ncbi:MAG: hypothetical protein ACRCUJ_04640 [Phocaeicola sp.]
MILLAVHFFFLDKKETEPKKKSRLPGGGYFSAGFCVRKGTCTSCFGQPFLFYAKPGASVLRPHQEAGPRDATLLGLCPRSFLFVVCCNFAWLRLRWLLGFNFTRFARSLLGLASPSLVAWLQLYSLCSFVALLGFAFVVQLYSLCSLVGFAFAIFSANYSSTNFSCLMTISPTKKK